MPHGMASSGTYSSLAAQLWGICWSTLLWTDSVTDKMNNGVDHHVQQVINNNSVKEWRAVLNAGFLFGLILFSVFTNNLVNAIKDMIIKKNYWSYLGEGLHIGWKRALSMKSVITAFY